jgi:hypothetical protein
MKPAEESLLTPPFLCRKYLYRKDLFAGVFLAETPFQRVK